MTLSDEWGILLMKRMFDRDDTVFQNEECPAAFRPPGYYEKIILIRCVVFTNICHL